MRLRYFAAVLLLGAAASTARGQSIQATTTTRTAFVNEWFTVQVTVTDPSTATAPTPPQTPDFEIRMSEQPPSHNSQVYIVNGRQSKSESFVYTFRVKPLRAGVLSIPPFALKDGDHAFQSEPIRLLAQPASKTPYLLSFIRADPGDRAYVGQVINVTLEVWIRRFSDRGVDLDPSTTWRGLLNPQTTSLGVFAPGNSPKYRQQSRKDESGVDVAYYVYYIESTMQPAKAGKLDVGGVQVGIRYPVRLARNIWGEFVFDGEPRNFLSSPELPDVKILPVPTNGRPADYNGAVGVFTITTEAKPTNVPVGDPITLTMTIRGAGILTGLRPPKLDKVPELARDFEISGESLAGEVQGDVKTFSQTIRPKREDVKEIPPLPMSYFDPHSERFETVRSRPIAIQVRPAERVAMQQTGQVLPSALTPLVPLEETADGILPNETNPDKLLANPGGGFGKSGWAILFGCPAIYLGALFVQRRAQKLGSNEALRRRGRAYKHARQILDSAQSPSAATVRAAVLGYIADRFNVPAGGLTRVEAVELLAKRMVLGEDVQAVDSLLLNLEQEEFGGGNGQAQRDTAGQARSILDRLERCRTP